MSSSMAIADATASYARADDLSYALVAERPRLVRLCRQMTGSAEVAEDLAQETLLEAWRLLDRLREPAGLSAWLSAIARNVCLRWLRAHGRERAHLAPVPIPEDGDESADSSLEETFAADLDDPLTQVERAEVQELLSQALASLPEPTRALTLASAAMSTSELARTFDLSEGAVRVRLHRARQTLRRALSGDLRAEAEALDLTLPAAPIWTESRIWCPFCGVGHLRYRVDRETGEFAFHCSGGCCAMTVAGRAANGELVREVSSPKSLVTRHCLALATTYRAALAGENLLCDCGAPVTYTARFPGDVTGDIFQETPYGVIGRCPNCGLVDISTSWHLALDTVEAQRFWRRHPRMRSLPLTHMERDNRAAIVTGFEAVGSGDRLVIVSDATTYALLRVETTDAP
jgi:RNA polymerase sigma factor (sigma-70 family)